MNILFNPDRQPTFVSISDVGQTQELAFAKHKQVNIIEFISIIL